jgi:hypothetical protein
MDPQLRDALVGVLVARLPELLAAALTFAVSWLLHRAALERVAIRAAHEVVSTIPPSEIDHEGVEQAEKLIAQTISGKLSNEGQRRAFAVHAIQHVRDSMRPKKGE